MHGVFGRSGVSLRCGFAGAASLVSEMAFVWGVGSFCFSNAGLAEAWLRWGSLVIRGAMAVELSH
eukprot:7439565-Alexandrium_andersonii.AAC.1